MKKVSIDRFEGTLAICEDLNTEMMCDIEKKRIPPNAKEGDILNIFDNGKISIDVNETITRKEKISQLQNEVFNNYKTN